MEAHRRTFGEIFREYSVKYSRRFNKVMKLGCCINCSIYPMSEYKIKEVQGDYMSKKQHFLTSAVCLLCGIIIGFFIAPIKQGIGNNCGNNYHYYKDEENKDEEK